jgi:pimeloyl-ACP methyl ester carboxylesterase
MPVVVGHSLGGLVVAKYLEKHEAPAGILVAPSPSEGMFWSGMRLQIQNPLLLTECALKQDLAIMFATPERAKRFLFSADADDAKVSEYAAHFGSESYRANMEMIWNLPKPEKVKAPMLVVGAANDALLLPAKIEKTARAFNADCKIFPDMAHDMMLERGWQKVADFMFEWLEKKIR